jgi:H+-transporting ATPase
VAGPVAAFGLFHPCDRVYHLNHAHLRALMYLMLSVAGSMTIYLTRTRGPFCSSRPARILVMAVTGGEAIATLLAGS